MAGFVSTTGSVSDSATILMNRNAFVDIEYPIPHVMNNYGEKKPHITVLDTITEGLNYYDHIASIEVKSTENVKMNESEMEELKSILMGGVIYNGSSS